MISPMAATVSLFTALILFLLQVKCCDSLVRLGVSVGLTPRHYTACRSGSSRQQTRVRLTPRHYTACRSGSSRQQTTYHKSTTSGEEVVSDLKSDTFQIITLSKSDSNNSNSTNDDDSDTESSNNRETILFLPGLDGQGSYSRKSFNKLLDAFNIKMLLIAASDETPFLALAEAILRSIKGPVTLIGESFGGLLASYICSRDKKGLIKRLVLINPATSYDRTSWDILSIPIVNSGPLFPIAGVATLLLTAVQPQQIMAIGQQIAGRINSTASAIVELNSLANAGSSITSLLPAKTLDFRLREYLRKGAFLMNDNRYRFIKSPTLLLISNNDRLLPSKSEGPRLKKLLSKTTVVDLKTYNKGHALLDDSFNLLEALRNSTIFSDSPSQAAADNLDYKQFIDTPFPSVEMIADYKSRFGAVTRGLSPVFLSRLSQGDASDKVVEGIAELPVSGGVRPVLYVGNHQLFGADLGIIVEKFLDDKKTLVRGMAHPVAFMGGSDGMQNLFAQFGAVPVSPQSFYELLKRNETILLFPGGVQEAYHNKNDDYKLFWPEKIDFLRMAALFDAIVVPFSAIGIADSFNIIADKNDILNLPFGLGDRARSFADALPQARAGGDDIFISPIAVPKLPPSRVYFLFHKPIDTRDLKDSIMAKDKSFARQIYNDIRQNVESGIEDLKAIRTRDPYSDFLKRSAYETIYRVQAPFK